VWRFVPFPPEFTFSSSRLFSCIDFNVGVMKVNGHRVSLTQLAFIIVTFVIISQLWSVWQQSVHPPFLSFPSNEWQFDADLHANVHTLSNEQCDIAFPKLYHSLDLSVRDLHGEKVAWEDIEIAHGRCMLRVLIHGGEVRSVSQSKIYSS
jgi:hypothetical protein